MLLLCWSYVLILDYQSNLRWEWTPLIQFACAGKYSWVFCWQKQRAHSVTTAWESKYGKAGKASRQPAVHFIPEGYIKIRVQTSTCGTGPFFIFVEKITAKQINLASWCNKSTNWWTFKFRLYKSKQVHLIVSPKKFVFF